MDIVIRSDVLLFGDCLERVLRGQPDISVTAVVTDDDALIQILERGCVELVLVDVSGGLDVEAIRQLRTNFPGLLLVALGIDESEQRVLQCASAGFAAYVPRHADVSSLTRALSEALCGRQRCPDHISAGLFRALGNSLQVPALPTRDNTSLSPRERAVATFLKRGYSNKEIARELNISIATVKHHVHRILDKLRLSRRGQIQTATSLSSGSGRSNGARRIA